MLEDSEFLESCKRHSERAIPFFSPPAPQGRGCHWGGLCLGIKVTLHKGSELSSQWWGQVVPFSIKVFHKNSISML